MQLDVSSWIFMGIGYKLISFKCNTSRHCNSWFPRKYIPMHLPLYRQLRCFCQLICGKGLTFLRSDGWGSCYNVTWKTKIFVRWCLTNLVEHTRLFDNVNSVQKEISITIKRKKGSSEMLSSTFWTRPGFAALPLLLYFPYLYSPNCHGWRPFQAKTFLSTAL